MLLRVHSGLIKLVSTSARGRSLRPGNRPRQGVGRREEATGRSRVPRTGRGLQGPTAARGPCLKSRTRWREPGHADDEYRPDRRHWLSGPHGTPARRAEEGLRRPPFPVPDSSGVRSRARHGVACDPRTWTRHRLATRKLTVRLSPPPPPATVSCGSSSGVGTPTLAWWWHVLHALSSRGRTGPLRAGVRPVRTTARRERPATRGPLERYALDQSALPRAPPARVPRRPPALSAAATTGPRSPFYPFHVLCTHR
jgi:hypothetical protein